jgi:hypothetical protein
MKIMIVKSARKFYKEFIDALKAIGFYGSKSDPCLRIMWDDKVMHILIVGMYLDIGLNSGKESRVSIYFMN